MTTERARERDESNENDPDLQTEVRAAIVEVRRESLKAAGLSALLDATVTFLAVNLALGLSNLPELADPVGPVPGRVLFAAAAGLVVGAVEFAWRARQPSVERFETTNPAVSEALRTARDAVESDRDGRMVRALYADVLDRLTQASSRDLVPWTRLAATLLVLVALSGATVGVSGAGIAVQVGDQEPEPTTAAKGGSATPTVVENDTQLQDPDDVLGKPTDVSAGENNVSAAVDAGTGGQGDRDPERYDRSGYADDGNVGVDAQRAGYVEGESVDEADLIRDFTLALDEDDEN